MKGVEGEKPSENQKTKQIQKLIKAHDSEETAKMASWNEDSEKVMRSFINWFPCSFKVLLGSMLFLFISYNTVLPSFYLMFLMSIF